MDKRYVKGRGGQKACLNSFRKIDPCFLFDYTNIIIIDILLPFKRLISLYCTTPIFKLIPAAIDS